MKTLTYLSDPALASLYWPGVIAGIAIGLVSALLSPLVVLKRMSFIGQGISHAAFGGIGIAAFLAALTGFGIGRAGQLTGLGGLAQLLIVFAFCLGAALLIARMTDRRTTPADTAIGIVLVASMALGAVLMHQAWKIRQTGMPGWESVLFGSILAVDGAGAAAAALVAAASIAALAWFRRPMLFWAFDEPVAPAFGIAGGLMRATLVVLLTLAIVVGMRLVGVVLITAMLVLPGATALRLSDRLYPVFALSTAAGVLGVTAGLIAAFELDWPPGPCIVGVLTALYASAWISPRPRT